jgi:hypothetical protein
MPENGTECLNMAKHGLTNEPSTSRMDVNAAQVEELILGC